MVSDGCMFLFVSDVKRVRISTFSVGVLRRVSYVMNLGCPCSGESIFFLVLFVWKGRVTIALFFVGRLNCVVDYNNNDIMNDFQYSILMAIFFISA